MKTKYMMPIAVAATLVLSGCLVSGQITIFQRIDDTTSTDAAITAISVDLNEEEDYVDHKDKIESVDEISVVAIIENNLATAADVMMYISDDPSLVSLAELEDPSNATLVFVGPTVPASGTLRIGWEDGYRYVVNEQAVADQVFGDGIFVLYVVADGAFNLSIKAEVAITLTVQE